MWKKYINTIKAIAKDKNYKMGDVPVIEFLQKNT